MKTIANVAVTAITFIIAAGLTEELARVIPGTPANDFSALIRKATTAQELAAILSSAEGCRLLTVHSEWILFAYLPVASVATSIVGRALRMSSWLLLGVVSILALSRIVIMWVAGQLMQTSLGSVVLPCLGLERHSLKPS